MAPEFTPADDQRSEDADADRIPIEEWDRVVAAVEQFDAPGMRETVDELCLEFDRASLTIGRDGTVEGTMPLHTTAATAEWIELGPEADAITVGGPELRYTFRRP